MHLTDSKTAQTELMAKLRQRPNDVDARLQLFRFAVMDGNWTRASAQLDVASKLDASLAHTAMVYRHNIGCEILRNAVISGKQEPMFLGVPAPWAGYLVQAITNTDPDVSADLVYAAMERADAVPGTVNGKPFEWFADADNRFGPLLEAFIDGKYYWVPFENIERVTIRPPEDLLDLAWCPCEIVLTNGGVCNGYIPTRYPGTESASREEIKFARMTEWIHWSRELHKGEGQRMFISNLDEFALLDCREIVFAHEGGHA